MSTWFSILSRRKPLPNPDHAPSESGQLARVLSTLDLTALGVGSTLGVGVYVLAGHVAKETAGPAVVLSFLIAAVASVFAGLCYAEFGARVPKAGSAYVYSYVCVGELIAFIIGWNLILEYVIGSASVAKGLSVYLDTLVNNSMRTAFIDVAPIHSSFMSEYFDFFSLTITLVLGAALAFGMKESSLANNIFTLINILVVVFVIIAGGIKANSDNWNLKVNDTIREEYNAGNGGFLPFGIEGVIKGAATCFYGFVGFDCIATTGEEVKNPQRAIPISIILSLFIIFLSYFGTSAVVTLMLPYYLQDPDAPIPHAFEVIGWNWAKWIVSIGGIFGLCASLFGAMFPLPRIIYAMANDALVFRFLGTVNQRFKTPVVGTLLAALLTGLMSALFNLKQLVNMMSIGTLMAYTIVAACVIILRYSDVGHSYDQTEEYTENLNLIPPSRDVTMGTVMKTLFNFSKRNPTYLTQRLVTILVFIFCVLSFILACLLSYLKTELENGELYVIIPLGITVLCMLVTLIGMYAQPKVNTTLSFKVPLVPLIPALSICINIYLMLMLDGNTWIRFGVWMAIGLPIYLISCKPYYPKTLPIKQRTNGTINNGFVPENGTIKKNGIAPTIPDIVVDPPSVGEDKMEDSEESETEDRIRQRSLSINSSDFNNAVLEIDKVLSETENNYDDNFEAVNPENEYKNESILIDNVSIGSVRSYQSICSSSGSEHSKEYHIEAEIHQEDSDEPNDQIEETNDLEETDEVYIPPPPPIQGLLDEMTHPILISPTIPKRPPLFSTKDLQEVELKPVAPKQSRKRTESTTSEGPIDNVKAGSEQLHKIKSKLDKIFQNRPVLLPLNALFLSDEKVVSPTPEKKIEKVIQVVEDIPDDIPVNFSKTQKFKDNLSNLILRRQSINNNKPKPDNNFEKPDVIATKTDEIKHKTLMANNLKTIRLRKTGLIPDEKEDKSKEDENNVKELQQINSDKDKEIHQSKEGENKVKNPQQNNPEKDKEKDKVKEPQQNISEKDKEKHKRLMIATLRNIKLRRTGLALNDETESKDDISTDDIAKEDIDR